MSQPSPLFQLVEARLDCTLAEYVEEHHATDSWRTMAADIVERTGVSLNAETLRLWFAGRITTKVVVLDEPAGAA